MGDDQRCPTHGCYVPAGTICPMCISQMNAQQQAPLGDLPRAQAVPVTVKAVEGVPTGANRASDGFGDNDTKKPKRTDGRKPIRPEDRVWFGKHKGTIASSVSPDYWVWANENLAWLAVDPQLLEGAEEVKSSRVIGRDTELTFGKYKGRPASLCPADYIVWLSENTSLEIDPDFLEDCRVEMNEP